MSDDEEGGYNTITHLESGRGVKLLFSKSKVRHHSLLTEEGLCRRRRRANRERQS
jgi:hypothetical protein